MKSDDEQIEIEYQYDRLNYYKKRDPDLYDFYKKRKTLTVRFVNIVLSTGEIETLITNLSDEDLLQAVQNEATEEIEQDRYKHKMKININMAVGYIKRYFIIIMLADNTEERSRLYTELHEKILKNIVPIRDGRKYERKSNVKNRHHINKRKSD